MPEDVPIAEDGSLAPPEKETQFRWSKTEKRVHVQTQMAGVMNRLLHHPEFEETNRRVVEGDVVALWGTLPLGVLSIGSNPRSSGSHADVVSAAVMRDG